MIKQISLTVSISLVSVASATNISLNVTGTEALALSDGSTALANGNAVWIGSFDTGFNIDANKTDFSALAANFGFFDDVGTFQSGTPLISTLTTDFGIGLTGSFTASNAAAPDAGGNQPPLYVWAFNNSDASSATEYGIFQLTPLANGVSPLGVNQSLDFETDHVDVLFGSYNSGTGVGSLGVVPEPSVYAVTAGLLALTWVMVRRRV